jgi:hypothetical protein
MSYFAQVMSKWPMLWSDIMLVAFLSVTEVACCLVKYMVGLVFHEKGLVAQAERRCAA